MELQWFVSAKPSLRNRHITASKNPSSSIRQDRKIPLCQRTSSKARQDQWKRQKRTPCNMNNCNSVTEHPLFQFFRFFHVLFPLRFPFLRLPIRRLFPLGCSLAAQRDPSLATKWRTTKATRSKHYAHRMAGRSHRSRWNQWDYHGTTAHTTVHCNDNDYTHSGVFFVR